MPINSRRGDTFYQALQATKIFTDRMDPRKAFWLKYAKAKANVIEKQNNVSVLTYYGIGGIGKSELLMQIERECQGKLKDAIPKEIIQMLRMDSSLTEVEWNYFSKDLELEKSPIRYVKYDFNQYTDMADALCTMADRITNTNKFSFPLFKAAIFYYQMKGGNTQKKRSEESILDKNSILNEINSLIGSFSLTSLLVTTGIRVVDKLIALGRTKYQQKQFDDYIRFMEESTQDEHISRLPYYFASDISKNLEDVVSPFVFIFDTYEKLVDYMAPAGNAFSRDRWIRDVNHGLIVNIPNAMFVIAGRECLKWGDWEPDWNDTLEQHIMGALEKYDAIEFLLKTGVVADSECRNYDELLDSDRKRIDAIMENTKGVPIYLDICVNICQNRRNLGKPILISDFSGKQEELIERYYTYMQSIHRLYVEIFSWLGIWTDTIAERLAQTGIFPGFNCDDGNYKNIINSSIINILDEGIYAVHDVVSNVFKQNSKKNVTEKCVRFLYEELENSDMECPIRDFYFLQYIKIKWTLCLDDKERSKFLYENRSRVWSLISNCKFESVDIIISFINSNSHIGMASSLICSAWQLRSDREKGDFRAGNLHLLTYNDFIYSLDSTIHYTYLLELLSFLKAEGRYSEGIEIAETYHSKAELDEECKAELYNCIGDLYQFYGNLERAYTLYEKYYHIIKSQFTQSQTTKIRENYIIACKKMGGIYEECSNFSKALEYYMVYYRISRELMDIEPTVEHIRSFAVSCTRIGSIYKKMDQLDLSREYYEEFNRISLELYKKHPTDARLESYSVSCSRLGSVYEALGDLERAETYYNEDYTIMKSLYENDPEEALKNKRSFAISCERIGKIYEKKSNLTKALEFYDKFYSIIKDIYEQEPTEARKKDCVIACATMIRIYEKLGDKEKTAGFKSIYLKVIDSNEEQKIGNIMINK